MKPSKILRSGLAFAMALCCATSALPAHAATATAPPTIASFFKQFNAKVAKLPQTTYKGMKLTSYGVKSDKVSFSINGAPRQGYVQSTTMKASYTGRMNDDKAILEMTMTAVPKKDADAVKDSYTEEWTTAATLMLTSLFPDATDQDARNLMQNEIGMPIVTGGMLGLTQAREFSGPFGGHAIVARGERGDKGIVTLTVAVASGSDADTAAGTKLVAGKSVTVSVGAPFYLDLTSNAGTGYVWEYNSSGPGTCRLVGVSNVASANLPGGSQTERWSFTATRIGKLTLQFSLSRSWEGFQKGDQVQTFTVNIVK